MRTDQQVCQAEHGWRGLLLFLSPPQGRPHQSPTGITWNHPEAHKFSILYLQFSMCKKPNTHVSMCQRCPPNMYNAITSHLTKHIQINFHGTLPNMTTSNSNVCYYGLVTTKTTYPNIHAWGRLSHWSWLVGKTSERSTLQNLLGQGWDCVIVIIFYYCMQSPYSHTL